MLRILIFLVCVWGVARFCLHETDGFTLAQIRDNTYTSSSFACPDEVKEILNQRFRYLDRGKQAFVFVSEDGKYVLKLFNNRYQRKKEEAKLKRNTLSYQIAYENLRKETGLLYMQTDRSNHFAKPIVILDKLGIAHCIDLNEMGFALQWKAELVFERLKRLRNSGAHAHAKRNIASLKEMIRRRVELGIGDRDALMRANFGFIGDEAVEIDVGAFTLERPESQEKELARVTKSLKRWLETHYPEMQDENLF